MKYKNLILLSYFFILILLSSCNILNDPISFNRNKSEKLFNDLSVRNGNAFLLTSTNANFSFVWSYYDNQVVVYEFVNGIVEKVTDKNINHDWIYNPPNDFYEDDFIEACIELDGDLLKFVLTNDVNNNIVLPLNFKCFLDAKTGGFYQNLEKDMRILKIPEMFLISPVGGNG